MFSGSAPVRLLVALLIIVLSIACGGGGDDLGEALQSVTDDQLALMVLSQDDLGSQADGMEIDSDSGYEDAGDEADDTLDPDDTGSDLTDAGFEKGYGLSYIDNAALEDGQGSFTAGTSVIRFDSEESAAAFLNKQFEDAADLEGEEVEEGVSLDAADEFDGVEAGEEARFVKLTISGGDSEVHFTGFNFRMGPLVARGGVASFEDADFSGDVDKVAEALEERIKAVLNGDVEETPIPIPSAEPTPEPVTRDTGIDILPEIVPGLDELPPGFESFYTAIDSIEEEADLGDDPDLFERQLDSWGFLLGYDSIYGRDPAQGTFEISFEVWLHEDADAASEALLDGGLYFSFDGTEEQLLPDFPTYGDESEAYRVTGTYGNPDVPDMPIEGYMVIMRAGEFLGVVWMASPVGQSSQAEAEQMAAALEAGMQEYATPGAEE